MKNDKSNSSDALTVEQELEFMRNQLRNVDPTSSPEVIAELEERLEIIVEATSKQNKLLKFFFYSTAILFVSLLILLFTYFQNEKYQRELESRLDTELATFVQQDSLFNKYLAVDSAGKYEIISEGGRVLSYQDLNRRNDSLLNSNSKLRDSLISQKQKLSMAEKSYGISFSKEIVGDNSYITMKSSQMDELKKENEKLIKNLQSLIDSLK